MKHSIVIVDDHILIAKALRSIIANFPNFEVWFECENGRELQRMLETEKRIPNIVLLDVSMPIMDGFETAYWLKNTHPATLVLALSMQNDEMSVIRMIKNGAKGYLLKNAHPIELEKALNSIVKVGHYYPDWAASKIYESLAIENSPFNKIITLTDREKEFLKYSVTEMGYKEIGEKMSCSSRTVESYRNSLFEKLDLKTRVGLAVYAIRNGIV